MQDGVFEFSRNRQRPEVRTGRVSIFDVAWRRVFWTLDKERSTGVFAIDIDRQMSILNSSLFNFASKPAERYPARRRRSIRTRGELERSSRRRLQQLRARNDLVHQLPIDGALAPDSFLSRAEKIRAIAPDAPLIDQPRQSSRAR